VKGKYNIMNRSISAKQYIKEFLIEGIGDIIKNHAYFGFPLICSGIEFLGICLDSASNWNDEKKSVRHFKDAVDKLFPNVYAPIKNQLYKELRCGMIHAQLSGNFKLTEVKNDGSTPLHRGYAAAAIASWSACLGGRPRRLGATQAGSGTW
jgi:hypothetical protein